MTDEEKGKRIRKRLYPRMGEKLRQARLKKFRTARAAAKFLNLPEGSYAGYENGFRGYHEKISVFAKAFDIAAESLVVPEEQVVVPAALRHSDALPEIGFLAPALGQTAGQVRVLGDVGAGIYVDESVWLAPAYQPVSSDPRYPDAKQVAFRVVGEVMNRDGLAPDGSFLVCIPYFHDRKYFTSGDYVIVEHKRSGLISRTVRRLLVVGDEIMLDSASDDPRIRRTKLEKGVDAELHEEQVTHRVVQIVQRV